MPLPNAQFVFLAACQTAMEDTQLVNVIMGFITAGFQSAIGTMWSMNDNDGPVVTEIVYSHLFPDGQHVAIYKGGYVVQTMKWKGAGKECE
jgi:CHAT domain-containing protein